MKTTNNETKLYAAASSVVRWARKNVGDDWIVKGEVKKTEDGKKFYWEPKVEKAEVKEDGLLHKSSIGSPCQVVWDIAEEMEGAKRKDVLAACVEAGIAFYTARTQYQKYREAVKEMESAKAA